MRDMSEISKFYYKYVTNKKFNIFIAQKINEWYNENEGD